MQNQPEPTIVGMRGVLVYMGLGTPLARAFVAGSLVGMGAYAVGAPGCSFTEEGKMRPFKMVSRDPEACYTHFLVLPLAVAAGAYLFT